ncbi:MAG: dynamin family protein [Bacteroidales bacterium]|nr:dynamin family protein [Bacteroidales bacterium]
MIQTPDLFPVSNLRLMDTPGVNSTSENNTQTTLDWLPEVGLTLMVISTSQPLSKQDIQLIRQAVKFSPDIRIILSKTDLLSQSETGQMIRYLRSELKKEFDRDFRIYPYSVSDPVYRDQANPVSPGSR